jgi:hypothetical protein
VIRRLKNKDQFQGARYELVVAATMVRAGYTINYEDERDGSKKHTEFIAQHRGTGTVVSVEAKSRHRAGVLGQPGDLGETIKADVGRLLTQAVLKQPLNPFVIFVDLNVPPLPRDWATNFAATPLAKELMKTTHRAGQHFEDGKEHFNAAFFTNFPHHYAEEDQDDPPKHHLVALSGNPLYPIKDKSCLFAIGEALNKYGRIPKDFSDA